LGEGRGGKRGWRGCGRGFGLGFFASAVARIGGGAGRSGMTGVLGRSGVLEERSPASRGSTALEGTALELWKNVSRILCLRVTYLYVQ
jgi:hypothetical protein